MYNSEFGCGPASDWAHASPPLPRLFFSSGHYSGKSVAHVVLKEPGYATWLIEKAEAWGSLKELQTEAKRLVHCFDCAPIERPCWDCQRQAVKLTAVTGRTGGLHAWCNNCRPASYEKAMIEIRTYGQALRHNTNNCRNTKAGQQRIIGAVAEAKGLEAPFTELRLASFFRLQMS